MLNISHESIDRNEILKDQSAYQQVMESEASKRTLYLLSAVFFIGIVVLFLPWTQNIRARGKLTTMLPENREQNIHTVISGRVEKWHIREGQFVHKGDTIVNITEMKVDYLDPRLLERTQNQTEAKQASVLTYRDKAKALSDQISALKKNRVLKIEQTKNYLKQTAFKVTSDSIDYQTTVINYEIAQKQYDRQKKLYEQGLKSLTELEKREQKLQQTVNKKIASENKWLARKNEFINYQLSLNTVDNDYKEKIAKAQSDRMSALSNAFEAESEFNKLSIQQANYTQRASFYHIKAPQDGFVTKALINGIGETVKAGEAIFSFIPSDYSKAVELYINPIDLPLIREGNQVRLQFDGWPVLVFRGWPNLSFGTFAGVVKSFDKAASPNGKFRILVVPDPDDEDWPSLLRLGSGAYGIALLKHVPVWYELWRNLNGFPPDFYIVTEEDKKVKASN